MANIMINQVCNLKCPYCFANEFVNKDCAQHKGNMTMENFKKAIDFSLSSGTERIGIIGGEPTLHPQFREFVKIANDDPRVKDIVVFTNGVSIDANLDIFMSSKVHTLINLNSPNDMGQKSYDRVISNLDKLAAFGSDKFSLGINMYKPNFDFGYMINALKRYKKTHVRTAIAVPNSDTLRHMSSIEYFNTMKPSVFNFFEELYNIDVMPTYDCNYMPTCITTPAEKEWLRKFWNLEKPNGGCRCNITDNPMCSPVIDILPNLDASRCFGLSEILKANIMDFDNIQQLRGYFQHQLDNLLMLIPTNDSCKDCIQHKSNSCSGGCLAFKLDKFTKVMDKLKDEID